MKKKPATKKTSAPISLRAYARHRGTSHQAVLRAIARKRLNKCLVIAADGTRKISSIALADAEWKANTDLTRAHDVVKARAAAASVGPAPPLEGPDLERRLQRGVLADLLPDEGPTIADAAAKEKHWRAKLAELNYKERAGELVNAKEVQAGFADLITQGRTKLLGLPSKLKQKLPHLTLDDLATIDAHVREALEELAGERPALPQDSAA